jgi:hypothetical protein
VSRTDKDRPYRVRILDDPTIHHDHTLGVCRVGNRYERWSRNRAHWRHCAKRVTVHYTCTKDDPERPRSHRWYSYLERLNKPVCWSSVCACPIPDAWRAEPHACTHRVRTQCLGHTRVERDDSIPCACDDFPPPETCYYVSPADSEHFSMFGGGGVPRDFVNATWHGPERRRERDSLGQIARDFNANHDYEALDDVDFPNPQARNRARWYYH